MKAGIEGKNDDVTQGDLVLSFEKEGNLHTRVNQEVGDGGQGVRVRDSSYKARAMKLGNKTDGEAQMV
jgi:hypothetical protein